MSDFGLNNAGEWSLAVTDCGKWVNGVGQGTRYEGDYVLDPSFKRVGSCDPWTDWQNYDQATKDGMKTLALASMDALQASLNSCLFLLRHSHGVCIELFLLDMENRQLERHRKG